MTLLCLSLVVAQGQQVVLNTRGERIVVYPDGSWRYYERGDSILINRNLIKKDILLTDDKQMADFDKSTVNPTTDSDISELANRFAERVSSEVIEARRALTIAVEDKFDAEAKLNQAQDNRKLIEPDILAKLDEEYEKRTQAVKSARNHVKWMEKMDASVREMLAMPIQKKPKALNKLISDHDAYIALDDSAEREIPAVVQPKSSGTQSESATQDPVIKTSSSPPGTTLTVTNNNGYRRAPVPCIITQPKSTNASSSTIAVEKQLLFTHTDEDLRPYFRQKELVTCYGSLMQIENNLYLSLEFQIASPDARRNFGILETNSMLRLKAIDGTFINLFNASADQGKIDAYTGNTIYTGNYLIDRESEKVLSRNELDKLRVVWSTGFEDYDIVHLDFLINQFGCLRNQ